MVSILMAAMLLAAADTPSTAGSTTAPAATAPAAAAAAPAKPKGAQMVCWEEEVTGSHYPHRVCTTRDELEARQRQDQQAISQHSRTNNSGGFGH
ncbi:MAG: hypothetical protein E7812_12800 [Phenylobacterium sp.]|nr:MAG: hypothetical protein E7812_12800 [Phenylobacterium sp.]